MGKQHDRERALRRLTGEEIVEETKKQAVKAWGKILPFGAQVIASAAAYSVGLTTTQLVGFVLKISCATPVLGPTMGLVGVGLANVLAGQASKHTRKMVVTRSHPLQPGFWEAPNPEDLVLDAVMGACIFKALGGRFSSVMPSDLTKPGALAFESIPVKANDPQAYAAPSVKRELARIYKRDGCHHCGTRKPPVIGDHMPPNAHVKLKSDGLGQWLVELPVVGKVAEALGAKGKRGPLQRFYPQCQPCSIKQATAVRTGKRVLVLHLHWPRRGRGEQLAGVFVGLRYNAPDISGSSGAAGRRSGKWASLTLASAAPMDGARIVDIRSPLGDASGLALQHLGPELSSSGTGRGWGSSNTITTAPYMQVTPLLEGSSGTHLGTTAWQQEQQQQPSHSSSPRGYLASSNGGSGAYTSGVVSYGSKGTQEGGKMSSSNAKGGAGSTHSMQHAQQWQRGPSGPGDERLPDQNAVGQAPGRLGQINASEVQGGLMVSLEGWAAAASTPSRQRGNMADVAMAPEHAKARAEAVFERHFAPGATY